MTMNILYVVVFLFEMLISTIFFSNISERKFPLSLTLIIGGFIFEIGAFICIFVKNTAWLNAIYSISANFVFSLICFNIKKIRSFFYSILMIAVSTILEVISVFIISSATNLHISSYQSKVMQMVIEIVISKIALFFVVMIAIKFIKEDRNKVKIPVTFFVYPIVTMITTTCFWYICVNDTVKYENQLLLGILSIILFCATIIVFFSFQANAQRENQLLLLQQEQEKIKTDITYFEILEQQNINLREYAHDAKNHLSAIKNLNTSSEIEMHISKMIESLAVYSKVSHSGNHTLDVIINKYVTECKINDINFDFDVRNNNLSQIEPYDLVTILGNLLDNAVEAAEKSEQRQVLLETDFKNDIPVIIVSNSCDNIPKLNGALPITTKENKQLHGIGLKSVNKTLKKYNGGIDFDYDDIIRQFIVTIMIGNSKTN